MDAVQYNIKTLIVIEGTTCINTLRGYQEY